MEIILCLIVSLIAGGFIGFICGAWIGQEIYKDKLEVKKLGFFSIENKRLTREQAAGAAALWVALTKENK